MTILPIFQVVRIAFQTVWSWIGSLMSSIVYNTGAFFPLRTVIFIGVGISVVYVTIKVIRMLVWGT